MSLLAQPAHIERLAAQGHEHRRVLWHTQVGPVLLQVSVDVALMKTDFVARPAIDPELTVHGLSVSRRTDWSGRELNTADA
jgi:hypothetical protein